MTETSQHLVNRIVVMNLDSLCSATALHRLFETFNGRIVETCRGCLVYNVFLKIFPSFMMTTSSSPGSRSA